jgi:hypothetical protein
MEMSQQNSWYSYIKQTKTFFFFYKIGKQEGCTGHVWGWKMGGVGERVWEGEYIAIMCTYV